MSGAVRALGVGLRRARAVADALALREWALGAFAGRTAEPPEVDETAWRLFVAVERCAAPLLRASGTRLATPGGVLREEATAETQRALAARVAVRELGRAALTAGLQLLVLKGGVDATEDAVPLYLTDVDLLVRPDDFARAVALLRSLGYEPSEPGAELRVERLRECNVVFAAPAGGVQVELHWTTRRDLSREVATLWASATPLGAAPGVSRLSDVEHAWHVLRHGVLDHPEQQGRLRDAIVLAHALARCTPADDEALRRRVASHSSRRALAAALSFAAALASGGPDTFAGMAAVAYGLRDAFDGERVGLFHRFAALGALYAAAGGDPGRRALRNAMRLDDVDGSRVYRLARGLPDAVRRPLARVARASMYAAHAVPAMPVLACATAGRALHALRSPRRDPLPQPHELRRPA